MTVRFQKIGDMFRAILKSVFLIVMLSMVAGPQSAFAEDVSVEATVNTTTVELGSSLRLTITINGVEAPAVQLPKIDGLELRYLGPSTKISLINGKMSRSTGLMFTAIPLKTGKLQIPSVTIPLSGKDYTTTPIDITVVDSGKLQSPSSPNSTAANSQAALQDKIFIVLSSLKKEVYFSEPVPISIKLFISDLAVKNVQYPTIRAEGFTVEPFAEPDRGHQVMGGIAYQVIEFKTYIYPTRAGDLSLGPAKLGANIMIQSSRRSDIPGDLGNVFDNDIFDEFMGRYDTKTVMLESAGLGIKVLPMPEEGKPANFSGGVGKYNFNMTVSPIEVKVGDPLTVRMRVSGDGNLKAIEMPAFKDSKDFKVYDPKISEQNGEKTLEQVVIPKHDQVKELPAAEFSYFDTAEKKYFTITKGPFPLAVSPLAKGEESKVVGLSPTANSIIVDQQPEELGKDIHFIKENIGAIQKCGSVLYRGAGFITLLLLTVLAWLGLLGNYLFRQRLTRDHRLARRLQAPRQAKAGLAQAAVFLEKGDTTNFCDALVKTLQEYFGNKFHVPTNTVTVAMIAGHLKNNNDKVVEDLRQIFSECELVRFASAQISADKMKNHLQRAQEAIDFFERNVK
jgi:hypothetical protein